MLPIITTVNDPREFALPAGQCRLVELSIRRAKSDWRVNRDPYTLIHTLLLARARHAPTLHCAKTVQDEQ